MSGRFLAYSSNRPPPRPRHAPGWPRAGGALCSLPFGISRQLSFLPRGRHAVRAGRGRRSTDPGRESEIVAKRGRKAGTGGTGAGRTSRRKSGPEAPQLSDYRHAATRKNNPPAKIAAEGTVPLLPKARYAYDPHLPPVLRFDPTGCADTLETRLSGPAAARAAELLAEAERRRLRAAEAQELAKLLETAAQARVAADPWLEWTGKREKRWFDVDPVALHIHERISAQAILKVAARQDVQRSLFADPEQEYHEAVQFYRHDIDWTNRLILGDSLAVMSSLARREDLAGKVQMIYIDPPYGIKFASNFQPEVGRRDVSDRLFRSSLRHTVYFAEWRIRAIA